MYDAGPPPGWWDMLLHRRDPGPIVRKRMTRFLLSRANLIGVIGALTAGLAAALGVVGGWWPLAVGGAYAAGALVAPKEGGHRIDVSRAREAQDVRAALDEALAQAQGHTEGDVLARVIDIREAIVALATDIERGVPIGGNWETVRQIALDYLPPTLENYLNMPNVYRRTVRTGTGTTAHKELLDQLDLLDAKLEEIVADAGAGRIAEMEGHGEFLEARFADPLTW